jgi:DNA-binding NarL/FixJ family response regulator
MALAPFRVLLVDDFERFRRLIGSLLRNNPQLQVVGEASDGLEAVEKAKELQPDLILLDMGLPKLNGIEAARRIREVFPKSKILFVSQEGSSAIVEAALNDARGYILKSDLTSDLLPGVAAVLRGETFLSSSLTGHKRVIASSSEARGHHEVAFYRDDVSLVEGFSRCVQEGLRRGNTVVVALTEDHRTVLIKDLRALDGEFKPALEQGQVIFLDIGEVISGFMSNGIVDTGRLRKFATSLIDSAAKRDENGIHKVVVCGEGVSILLADSNELAALEVERVWDGISKQYGVRVFCGYVWNRPESVEGNRILGSIRACHSAALTLEQ